jgi:hypothetical protein
MEEEDEIKHKVVYRTKDVTLLDGTIGTHRFTVYQDPTVIRVTFLPYDETEDTSCFAQYFQSPIEVENPKDLLDYVSFFMELL